MSGTFNPPANPTVGQIYTFGGATWRWDGTAWVNANTGANFVATTGSTMTGPLVLSGNAPASAPLQAVPLQQVSTAIAAAPDNIGRNLLHNSLFAVSQRGGGPFTTNGAFTTDRWRQLFVSDTMSVSSVFLTDEDRAAIGDEAALYGLQITFTGNAAAGAYSFIRQSIEGLNRPSNKAVSPSFFAKATSGTPRLGFSMQQYFGTGGSPSPFVDGIGASQTAPLSTTFARYVPPSFTMPSVAGKTQGTNGDAITAFDVWFSSGATNNANAGNIGVQSGTVVLWGPQFELRSVATPLEKLDVRIDTSNCQRFYQTVPVFWAGYVSAANGYVFASPFVVSMRATPTGSIISDSSTNFGARTLGTASISVSATATATASGFGSVNVIAALSADL